MTPLRQRMLDALVLHGKAPRTQEAYISAVAQLARHYRRSPDSLNGAEIEAYLLHLLRERQLTRSTVNQAGCAINFLFGKVLGRDGSPCRIPLPHGPQRLPEILSRDEIARLLSCARTLKARTVLSCAYALGLRVSELCALRVEHIDTAADRMCVRVVQGKGAKDRYVPLPADLLALLRSYHRHVRPRGWLFSAATDPAQPLHTEQAQRWYWQARDAAGIYRRPAASMACATATPPICWSAVSTCTASRSGSATATSTPRRATCTWRGPTRQTAPAARR